MSNRSGNDRRRRRVRKRHSDILFDDPTGAMPFDDEDYDDAFGDVVFDPQLWAEDEELRAWADHPATAGAMGDLGEFDDLVEFED